VTTVIRLDAGKPEDFAEVTAEHFPVPPDFPDLGGTHDHRNQRYWRGCRRRARALPSYASTYIVRVDIRGEVKTMVLLDLQAMEPAGGYDDCHDRDRRRGDSGSDISLLLCG